MNGVNVIKDKFRSLFASLVILILISGCAVSPRRPIRVDPILPPKTIAVLPFTNQSNDIDAPERLREIFNNHLARKRGYILKPLKEIDSFLTGEGINDAGQLPAVSIEELGKGLNVDGIIYGELIDFSYVTVGVYMKRLVRAEFKLVNTKTGAVVWRKEKKASRTKIVFEDVGRAFAEQLKEKAAEKILSFPLREETIKTVRKALRTFPSNNW
ncbi:DUF799 family lipoprotein [bacterium]|nr:DUF799 family lipoprotein [bacterium]